MYHLRLIKGKSYWGVVRATEKEPDVFVEGKKKAEHLVKTGYFQIIDDMAEQIGKLEGTEILKKDGIDAQNLPEDVGIFEDTEGEEEAVKEKPIIMELQIMTKAELADYADKNGIDITGCKTKDDIFQKVIDAIARADDARAAIRRDAE